MARSGAEQRQKAPGKAAGASRQTDWGSASSSAGGAPRRAASGTGGLGALARPRERRDGPRHQGPVGAAPPPGPSSGDRRGSAPPSLSPAERAALAALHRAPRLPLPARPPGLASGHGPWYLVRAESSRGCPRPGPLLRAARPGPAAPALRSGHRARPRGPGQAAEAQGRQRWTPGRGVPAPGPVRTKPKRPGPPHRAGSPRRGQLSVVKAAASPAGPSGPPPRPRGSEAPPGVPAGPHRSAGPGERAGPARPRSCPPRWPPPRRDTAGAPRARAEAGGPDKPSRAGRCLSTGLAGPAGRAPAETPAPESRLSRTGVNGAARRRDGKGTRPPRTFRFFSRELAGAWGGPGEGTGRALTAGLGRALGPRQPGRRDSAVAARPGGHGERSAPALPPGGRCCGAAPGTAPGARSAGADGRAGLPRHDPGARGSRRPPSINPGSRRGRSARAERRRGPSGRGGGSAYAAAESGGAARRAGSGFPSEGARSPAGRERAAPLLF
ncbi:collagen alpha-2(I) chain-like [Haliaeetus albicilla]|uniref:collagen alpha-2(I) chain-like n=1 Tax=Haliaeetus albicilla TaxID=8969 RepID=UPI0037E8236B